LWSFSENVMSGPPSCLMCSAASFAPADIVRPKNDPGPVKASTRPIS